MPNKIEPKNIYNRLAEIQKELKAPKGQENTFAHYKYRSCEDILEAVKPLLKGLVLTIGDDVVLIGKRYYVKAIAKVCDGKDTIGAIALAREAKEKKGMDASQITGASSSYARKYALNGLFAIDDGKDADSQEPTKPVARKGNPPPAGLSGDQKYHRPVKGIQPVNNGKCPECGAVDNYHSPTCSFKKKT